MNPSTAVLARSARDDAVALCPAADVPFGEGRSVTVDGRRIGVFNTEAGYFAIDNDCPHEGGPLSDGLLADACVTCPLHGWRVDLRNGEVIGRAERVRSHPLEVREDTAGRFSCDVRLFAWIAELANTRSVTIDLPAGACAAVAVARALRAAGLEDSFGIGGSLRLAVNREYVAAGDVIESGDELALIPPVSGGAPVHVRITDEPLSLNALHDGVLTESAGAIVTFTGVTQDIQTQHFEAYAEMAQEQIERIAGGLLERYRLEAVAIEHRVGDVPPGEPSLIVAVSARRRQAAFSAAHEAIDRIKTEAPIWKLEVDGAGFRSWDRGEPAAFERLA